MWSADRPAALQPLLAFPRLYLAVFRNPARFFESIPDTAPYADSLAFSSIVAVLVGLLNSAEGWLHWRELPPATDLFVLPLAGVVGPFAYGAGVHLVALYLGMPASFRERVAIVAYAYAAYPAAWAVAVPLQFVLPGGAAPRQYGARTLAGVIGWLCLIAIGLRARQRARESRDHDAFLASMRTVHGETASGSPGPVAAGPSHDPFPPRPANGIAPGWTGHGVGNLECSICHRKGPCTLISGASMRTAVERGFEPSKSAAFRLGTSHRQYQGSAERYAAFLDDASRCVSLPLRMLVSSPAFVDEWKLSAGEGDRSWDLCADCMAGVSGYVCPEVLLPERLEDLSGGPPSGTTRGGVMKVLVVVPGRQPEAREIGEEPDQAYQGIKDLLGGAPLGRVVLMDGGPLGELVAYVDDVAAMDSARKPNIRIATTSREYPVQTIYNSFVVARVTPQGAISGILPVDLALVEMMLERSKVLGLART